MSKIVQWIRGAAPDSLKRLGQRVKTAREFFQDYRLYMKSTAFYKSGKRGRFRDETEVHEARVRLSYHSLEKGQTFAAPRRPFGEQKIARIEFFLERAQAHGLELDSAAHAQEAIAATRAFNQGSGISNQVAPVATDRVVDLDPEVIERLFSTRHSIRNFDPERALDAMDVADAVDLASRATPSVCNRRSYRAHYFEDRVSIDSLLELQNGNRGFGHEAPGLFVITVRRSSFIGANERNQRWVDGGLFAMTLAWVLHSKGIGTCMLNWSQTNKKSSELRARSSIPESEDIIVMMAVGYPRDSHRVAKSPRRAITDTFVRHRVSDVPR